MTPLIVSVPDEDLAARLRDLEVAAELVVWPMRGPAPREEFDVVVLPYKDIVSALRHLVGVRTRLVQSQFIGYDGVAGALPAGHVFANAATVHEPATGELALALILAAQRGIDDYVRAAGEGRWEPDWRAGLADRTVLLVGYGGVSRAIEDRLMGFEVDVLRVARTARESERGPVHAMSDLHELLGRADVVVVAVPLTEETTKLVNAEFLSHMRDGALLVNVARGRVADTDALVEAATSGRLRLALDVVDPEPLPAGHPLFSLHNVMISPHVGGRTLAMAPRIAKLVADQVGRLSRGEDPVNVVLTS